MTATRHRCWIRVHRAKAMTHRPRRVVVYPAVPVCGLPIGHAHSWKRYNFRSRMAAIQGLWSHWM